jgi:hypothetical protein
MSPWHSVSRSGLRGRRALRRFLYAQLAMRSAVMIALGREAPLVRFTVEADPPSVYFVFRILAEARDRLLADLQLPPGFTLAPIRCLAEDVPQHLLTLNVYRVSGITNGMRAEWSVYVADPDGVPRYLIVDARSSSRSMDPISVLTPASRVEHSRQGERITTVVGPPEAMFTAEVRLAPEAPRVASAPEWTTANDTIYWANGVCDRTFYDAGLADADQVAVAGSDVFVHDGTRWAEYLDPVPVHTLVYRRAIEFVVSPWANLDEITA